MFGGADGPNRGGGLGQRIHRVFGYRQHVVANQFVDLAQQHSDPFRVAGGHQCQICVEERQVAAERVEVDAGVPVDIALADLDAAVAQDGVGHGRVEVDVGQGMAQQKLHTRVVRFFVAALNNDGLVFRAVNLG